MKMSRHDKLALLLAPLHAVLFLSPALWNEAPLAFFSDTLVYLNQGVRLRDAILSVFRIGPDIASTQIFLGRSIFYSVFLTTGVAVFTAWSVAFLQATALCLVLTWAQVRLFPGRPVWTITVALAVLAATSTAGWFASLLMPDIFLPIMIVALSVLALRLSVLTRLEVVAAAALIVFSAATHDSHLAVLCVLALTILLGGAPWVGRLQILGGLGAVVTAAIVASAMNVVILGAVSGRQPARIPFLSAHLIDMGPGYDHYRATCPQAGYAICAVSLDRDTTWIEFLFSREPGRGAFMASDEATRIGLAREQYRFAQDVVSSDPLRVIAGLLLDALRQASAFGLTDLRPHPDWDAFIARAPAEIGATLQRSRMAHDPEDAQRVLSAITIWTYAWTLCSIALLALTLRARRRCCDPEAMAQLRWLAALTVTGVVANAVICGVLASPFDRFQARVIWLLPWLAILVVLARRTALVGVTEQTAT